MSWQPAGTVYGTLLNFRSEWDAWAPRMHEPPYQAPPRAPVLYVKTANTFRPAGSAVPLPEGTGVLEVGATVGLVMGPGGRVAGCVLADDLAVPHDSWFRPPVRFRCPDGLFVHGGAVVDTDPARVTIEVRVNGEPRQQVAFDALVRDPARLLADVAEFMTLGEGDVLLLGTAAPRPQVAAGDRVELRSPQLGTLAHGIAGAA